MNPRDATRYHYTIGYWARLILEDGEIKPTGVHVKARERPAVWFSTNPTWERTADKTPRFKGLSMAANAETGCGIYRFAVAPETAPLGWVEYVRSSGVTDEEARRLERSAKLVNSTCRNFFVSFDPVPQEKWLAVEAFDLEAYRWVPMDPNKLPSIESSRDLLACQGKWAPTETDT